MRTFRPAFMEEFSALEGEMERLFVQYSTRSRCLNYLERLASEAERAHVSRQQAAAAAKRASTVLPLQGEEPDILNFEEAEEQRISRPRASTGGTKNNQKSTELFL